MMVARELPRYQIKGKTYFRDDRLGEYRNVENPHDRITFDQFQRGGMELETPSGEVYIPLGKESERAAQELREKEGVGLSGRKNIRFAEVNLSTTYGLTAYGFLSEDEDEEVDVTEFRFGERGCDEEEGRELTKDECIFIEKRAKEEVRSYVE